MSLIEKVGGLSKMAGTWITFDKNVSYKPTVVHRDKYGAGMRTGLANALANAITGLYSSYVPLPLDAIDSIAGGGRSGGGAVSVRPIWSEEQIQTRVNESNALAGARTAQQTGALIGNLARQGMSTRRSPLAMSLAQQSEGRGLLASLQNENMLRWEAARGNAEHMQRAEIANAELAAREAANRAALASQVLNYNANVISARNRDLAMLSQILAGLMGPDVEPRQIISEGSNTRVWN